MVDCGKENASAEVEMDGVDQKTKEAEMPREKADVEKPTSPKLPHTCQRKWTKLEKMKTSSVDFNIIVERPVLY